MNFNMNMPNEYPTEYLTICRRNGMLTGASLTAEYHAKSIPNDPAIRYINNGYGIHFYMHKQNQWRWCGYRLLLLKPDKNPSFHSSSDNLGCK
jgi:hypothetical protein